MLLDLAVNAEYFIPHSPLLSKEPQPHSPTPPSIMRVTTRPTLKEGWDVRPCEGIPACMTLRVCCAGPQTKVAAEFACPHLPGLSKLGTARILRSIPCTSSSLSMVGAFALQVLRTLRRESAPAVTTSKMSQHHRSMHGLDLLCRWAVRAPGDHLVPFRHRSKKSEWCDVASTNHKEPGVGSAAPQVWNPLRTCPRYFVRESSAWLAS